MHVFFKDLMFWSAKQYLACWQLIMCAVLLCAGGAAQAQVRTFQKAYQTNAPGDILIIGNTITTCQAVAPAGSVARIVSAAAECAAGRNGTSILSDTNGLSYNNNNAHVMLNVDVDTLAPGLNSSTAGLQIPIGASVLWAGLYWGSNAAANTARNQISFKTPNGSYQSLTADWIATTNTTNYHAARTVTSLITSSGDYTVADIKQTISTTGFGTGYGGWSLVVVYQLNSEPFRNLTVFNGYQVISGGTTLPIRLDGFLTPSVGPVGAKVGIVAYEGDLGSTGDNALLNGTQLSNSLNLGTNLFNSSITRENARISDKTPDYINQLGFDIDIFNTSGVLPINATVTTVTLASISNGETYYPGVITTAIDIFVPNLAASLTKTVTDLNGGVVDPGDILEYTISFKNTGQDIATKVFVIDPIPIGSAFVTNSLKIVAGANTGAKTDAADTDQAEFDAAQNRVVFRLGTGASSTNGGSFALGASSTITFQVKVNPGTNGQTILNTATINYTGTTLPTTYTANASAAIAVAPLTATPSLTHQKTVQVLSDPINGITNPKNIPGAISLYTLTIQSTGSGTANSLTIADLIPTNSELFTGNFLTGTGTGSPFSFANGAVASGVACSFVALGDTTDCVEFSNDGGNSWVFVPNGAYDPAVTNIRFRLTGTMNGAATVGTPPYPGFNLQFKTRIK
jgi:uncharacterized repeat protein (TIGR01451 family)